MTVEDQIGGHFSGSGRKTDAVPFVTGGHKETFQSMYGTDQRLAVRGIGT